MASDPIWLLLILTLTIPLYESSELSIQAQLNQLTRRVTKLESEVKTLKVYCVDTFIILIPFLTQRRFFVGETFVIMSRVLQLKSSLTKPLSIYFIFIILILGNQRRTSRVNQE